MKPKKIFVSILSLILVFTLTGCFSKEKIDTKKFISVTKDERLTVYGITEYYKSYENLKSGYAASSLLGWRITFFEFKDSTSAEDIYEKEVKKIKKNKSKDDEEDTSGVRNYKTYELTTKSNYYYISRVDDTLLVVDSNKNNKDEIKKFIDKLGY